MKTRSYEAWPLIPVAPCVLGFLEDVGSRRKVGGNMPSPDRHPRESLERCITVPVPLLRAVKIGLKKQKSEVKTLELRKRHRMFLYKNMY